MKALIIACMRAQNPGASRVKISILESAQAASRHRLDHLFQSMLHQAFNGEL